MNEEDRRRSEGRRSTDQGIAERLEAIADVGASMEGVKAAVEALTSVIGKMATKEEVALAEARQQKRGTKIILGVAAAFVLVVLPLAGQALTVNRVAEVAEDNAAQGALLIECTTPGNPNSIEPEDRVHECYDEGRARSASTVAAINLAILDAVTCAVTVSPEDIPECYATKIEKRTGVRPDFTP